MANVNPLLLVGAVIGVVTALLVLACALVKDKKDSLRQSVKYFFYTFKTCSSACRVIRIAEYYHSGFVCYGFNKAIYIKLHIFCHRDSYNFASHDFGSFGVNREGKFSAH